jgi:hypothetical protein
MNIDSSVLEESHYCIIIKIKQGMFCNEGNKTLYVIRCNEDGLPLLCTIHSILKYGIIFWGNASLSVNIFEIENRIIRIMSGVGKFNSCRDLFKELQILPLLSQYIFSLLLFTIKNKITSYLTWIFMILIPVITII